MPIPSVSGPAGREGDTARLPGLKKKPLPVSGAGGKLGRTAAVLALPWVELLCLAVASSAAPGRGAVQNAVQSSARDPANVGSTARITYTRTLPGSIPEYLAVTVNSDGSGTYVGRQLKEAQQPRALKLSAATTEQIFALATALDDFRVPLESHKKVADLGRKTFTYEQGSQKNEVNFNYTTKATARDLTDLFERIAGVEEHLDALRYQVKYDPLSLPRELLQIQIDLRHNALADPELMVPELEEIANNPRLLHIAQVRAQDILKTVNHEQ
ncbi:MAG TPA: hypothetical protein VGZ29_06555 [Terriglobia bacterium]|nr:hypothetical protein [Terriglobia bacterium]